MIAEVIITDVRISSMKYYDRAEEIKELRRIQERAFNSRSRMTVITGRRRIGKTSLALLAMECGYPTVYLFVSRKNEAVLCSEFAEMISNQLGVHAPKGLASFREIFFFLMETGKNIRFNLIIDEFQEFLNVNPSIFSDMQNIWDTYRNITNVNMLLMGSVHSMMHKIFEDNHEPLFGRADNMLRLRGLGTDTMKEIMSDFRPGYTNDELLALYAITGGVPKYIELLCEDTDLSIDGMFDYVVRENSLFVNEGKNLLIEEFGKDYGTYFSVLGSIAAGKNTQGEIESSLGGMTVAGHLKRLIEDYGLIKRMRPVFAKPRSKNVRYGIADNFLRFWFNYFYRNQTLVEIRNFDVLREMVRLDYPTFSGHVLEEWFRLRMMESHRFVNLGGWWEKGGAANEIDIVGLLVEENRAVAVEVKRQRRNFKPERLKAKVERLKAKDLHGYVVKEMLLSLEDM